MEDLDYELATPPASSLIHSLRAFGYDLSTAVSDLIDNSLTAEATRIDINFWWEGSESYLYILDDGKGMSAEMLHQAMKPGSRSPLEKRDEKDLGRFGLGLKTASFSQAKQVTVATKQHGVVSIRKWDLDLVSETSQWRLLKTCSKQFRNEILVKLDGINNGTIVALEAMDRLVPTNTMATDSRARDHFYNLMDQLKAHLEVTFHRYLSPDSGFKKTRILLQGKELDAWDPYLSAEPSHRQLGEERIHLNGHAIPVIPHLLPHKSKLSDSAFKAASGPQGWIAQQGFYVYRNRRLLVAGSWLGLKNMRQDELHKLARIQIDLPNMLDDQWEIDVKKSRASPPIGIRDELIRIATWTRSEAERIYRSRGGKLQGQGNTNIVRLWIPLLQNNRITYQINRSHPVIERCVESGGESVLDMLRFIEETVPTVQHTDTEVTQAEAFQDAFPELVSFFQSAHKKLVLEGIPPQTALKILAQQDPFYRYPKLVAIMEEKQL